VIATLFLLAVLWNLGGVCAGLGVLLDQRLLRPVDLRHGVFLILLGFLGVAFRGQPPLVEWLSWPPMLWATWLTYRFVLGCSVRARAVRLLGRAVPHT
jgi:hypothetical protein